MSVCVEGPDIGCRILDFRILGLERMFLSRLKDENGKSENA